MDELKAILNFDCAANPKSSISAIIRQAFNRNLILGASKDIIEMTRNEET